MSTALIRRGRLPWLLLWACALAAALTGSAPAQTDAEEELEDVREQLRGEDDEDGEILVNMFVNYGFAYRQGTWVPVDVFIRNNQEDVKGWVELRTYAGDDLESPIYRLPAESPKGSQKRFQISCYLERTTRIEGRLYDGNQEVIDFPPWLEVIPIETDDLMGLALDDEGTGFGFLADVVNLDSKDDRRFHRETLPVEQLTRLARFPQCYAPFDVIILGNTSPKRIGQRHRDLLYDFVRGGGALVVCTGEHADHYHGTWVEDLLGVAIGAEEIINEVDLAKAAFPLREQLGAKGFRDCVVASLTPAAPDVKRCGIKRTIATRRPLGSGFAYAVAVDADSHALQACYGYKKLWNEIITHRDQSVRLNTNAAAQFAANTLPRISGIVIHSKASVMAYLAIYFGVAVVANWLLFSWLKRREWAWVALVVFAVGFTAYAVTYGTTGRAGASELHRIELLRVPKGGGMGRLESVVGILTARSATYAIDLERQFALVRDLDAPVLDVRDNRPGQVIGGGTRPFHFVQASPAQVDRFRVGASTMRLVQVETDLAVPGGVSGTVAIEDDGTLEVDLVNRTGYALDNPFLYVNGQRLPLDKRGDHYVPQTATQALGDVTGVVTLDINTNSYNMGRRGGSTASIKQFRHRMLAYFRGDYAAYLFSTELYSPYQNHIRLDPNPGPFLCGWVSEPGLAGVTPSRPVNETIVETLLVADVDLGQSSGTARTWRTLQVWPDMEHCTTQGLGTNAGARRRAFHFHDMREIKVYIGFSQDDLDRDPRELVIDLYAYAQRGGDYVFLPQGVDEDWPHQHREEARDPRGQMRRTVYRLKAWKKHLRDWNNLDDERLAEYRAMTARNRRGASRQFGPGVRMMQYGGQPAGTNEPPAKVLVGTIKRADMTAATRRGRERAFSVPTTHMVEAALEARVYCMVERSSSGDTAAWH